MRALGWWHRSMADRLRERVLRRRKRAKPEVLIPPGLVLGVQISPVTDEPGPGRWYYAEAGVCNAFAETPGEALILLGTLLLNPGGDELLRAAFAAHGKNGGGS